MSFAQNESPALDENRPDQDFCGFSQASHLPRWETLRAD